MTKLGVPLELQALFDTAECLFDFGDGYELFEAGIHKVPTSQNVWRSAPALVTCVIITHSVMEAAAYITLNRHKHSSVANIAFVATGNYPHSLQTAWIKNNFKNRKMTLVFGNCILGILADIKMAAGLRKIPLKMRLSGLNIVLECRGLSLSFAQESLSLHSFEKSFGIRSGIKTSKPKYHLTYLDQLLAHGK